MKRNIDMTVEEYDLFFTYSRDLFCIAGLDGYFRKLNPAWTELLGWSREELLSKPFSEFVHPDDRAATAAAVVAQQQGEFLSSFENRYCCKDGSYCWLSWNTQPLTDRQLICAVARDVTAERQSRSELAAQQARYEAILRMMPIAILEQDWSEALTTIERLRTEGVSDFRGCFAAQPALVDELLAGVHMIDANPVARRLFAAATTPELLTSLARQFAASEVRPILVDSLVALAEHETLATAEMRLESVAGMPLQLLMTMSLPTDGSSFSTVLLSFIDISQHKLAEEVLRRSRDALREDLLAQQEQLAIIFDNVRDYAFVTLDTEGMITSWNRGAERLHGYREAYAVGRHVASLQMPGSNELPEQGLQIAAAQGSCEREGWCQRRNGSRYWANVLLTALSDESGKLEGYIRVTHDATERHEVMQSLKRKNRDLETLLYVTSHDLREPLRAIQNFGRLIQERHANSLDATGQDYLTRIVRGADRMEALIKDLLTLSRAQRMIAPEVFINGRDLVESALERLQNVIHQQRARVQVAERFPDYWVDRRWITEALFNLIANALKFTRDGQAPEVEIAPWENAASGELGFVVGDRGPGVPEDQAVRIFTLFQRGVGRTVEGTGAGLAIVQQIAEMHGGNSWVEARDGGGSHFFISMAAQPRQHLEEEEDGD